LEPRLTYFSADPQFNSRPRFPPLLRPPSKEGLQNPTTASWLQAAGLLALEIHENITMKARQRENNFRHPLRKLFQRGGRRHDPMLVLNMSIFNFTDGWSRTFSKYEYARFYA
jgi:hypothetical protein